MALRLDTCATITGSSATSDCASAYILQIDGDVIPSGVIAADADYDDANWNVSREGTDIAITPKRTGLYMLYLKFGVVPVADCQIEIYFNGLSASANLFAPVLIRSAGEPLLPVTSMLELTADEAISFSIDGWYNGGGSDPGNYVVFGDVDVKLVELVTGDPS
jgi:hypothetical protein